MKNKVFSILSVLVILLSFSIILTGCSKSEYKIPIKFDDGFISKLKVPDNTTFTGVQGSLVMNFETTSSKEEVENFYDEYFSTLQIVYTTGSRPKDATYYYDESQRMIFSHLVLFDSDNDKIHFMIDCDFCEDINDNEYWTTVKPE